MASAASFQSPACASATAWFTGSRSCAGAASGSSSSVARHQPRCIVAQNIDLREVARACPRAGRLVQQDIPAAVAVEVRSEAGNIVWLAGQGKLGGWVDRRQRLRGAAAEAGGHGRQRAVLIAQQLVAAAAGHSASRCYRPAPRRDLPLPGSSCTASIDEQVSLTRLSSRQPLGPWA